MPGLKALQEAFKQNVLTGDQGFVPHVISTDAIPSAVRLAIYGNAYYARLEEALGIDFEIVKQLLGEEIFSEACMAYIHQYPSHYYSLRWFGQDFPAFLGYQADSGEHHWPAEMAQLEWTFTAAFDAADVAPATEADAAAIPPEAWPGLTMMFHPSVHLMPIWWNTLGRWRAAKEEHTVPEAERLAQPSDCLLWREGLMTTYRSVEPDEAVALRVALAGGDFSEICGALAEESQDQEMVPMRAAGFLKTWLAAQMLVKLIS